MNIGKFIKNHRKNLNMTQKELAKTLGVSHITVCRWETNFIEPNQVHWMVLQNLFGTRKDNLLMPFGTGIKKITPLKKLIKSEEIRNQEIANNYKKGIPLDNLAKFYNISETSIRSILISQKIKLPRKNTKKERICKICNKTFFSSHNNKSCSNKCLKILRKQNFKNKYRVEKNHVCCVCNKAFTATNRIGTNKYCSQDCYQKNNTNSNYKQIYGKTLSEIANQMGASCKKVSQLHQKNILKSKII